MNQLILLCAFGPPGGIVAQALVNSCQNFEPAYRGDGRAVFHAVDLRIFLKVINTQLQLRVGNSVWKPIK